MARHPSEVTSHPDPHSVPSRSLISPRTNSTSPRFARRWSTVIIDLWLLLRAQPIRMAEGVHSGYIRQHSVRICSSSGDNVSFLSLFLVILQFPFRFADGGEVPGDFFYSTQHTAIDMLYAPAVVVPFKIALASRHRFSATIAYPWILVSHDSTFSIVCFGQCSRRPP